MTPDELSGGTFTITNYGSAGALFDTPIVNQPEVAILAPVLWLSARSSSPTSSARIPSQSAT
ncbi:dihydrolipoamide acyltransferase [Cutibacterium acnes JCM 18916]|nr:dihydrolipoamide acyltransferase [Cutibacterium acnes JCM 18916]